MVKKNNSLKDAISHAEASALIAMTYTVGFFSAVMYMIVTGITYSMLGMLVNPTLYAIIFSGLMGGELTVLGFYGMNKAINNAINGNNNKETK